MKILRRYSFWCWCQVNNRAVFNLGHVFTSLSLNIKFWCKMKLSWSLTNAKKRLPCIQVLPKQQSKININFTKGVLTNLKWVHEMTIISDFMLTSSFFCQVFHRSCTFQCSANSVCYLADRFTIHLLTLFFLFSRLNTVLKGC